MRENAFVRSYLGNIFRSGNLRFCARTNEETELWMCVLINAKTNYMYTAPDLNMDDLAVLREAPDSVWVSFRMGTTYTLTPRCR